MCTGTLGTSHYDHHSWNEYDAMMPGLDAELCLVQSWRALPDGSARRSTARRAPRAPGRYRSHELGAAGAAGPDAPRGKVANRGTHWFVR